MTGTGINQRKLIGLTAPSGAGKSTIARRVLDEFPSMRLSISVTTRPPRSYECHGREYYFVSTPEFKRLIDENALLEYEEVYPDCFYGTPLSALMESDRGPLLLDLDVKGSVNVRTHYGGLFVFIAPPSRQELEHRLIQRGTESADMLKQRLLRADLELAYSDQFDAVVINDSLERATQETISIIKDHLKDD